MFLFVFNISFLSDIPRHCAAFVIGIVFVSSWISCNATFLFKNILTTMQPLVVKTSIKYQLLGLLGLSECNDYTVHVRL